MTRTQAIAVINARLATLDDAEVASVAEIVDGIAARAAVRQLTPRELALLNQSKADFAAGRSLAFDELVAELDRDLAPLGVPAYLT